MVTKAPLMNGIDFDATFQLLSGNQPFPWQRALYDYVERRGQTCRI